VLDFARFIPLPSEYDAQGLSDSDNLQIVADVQNQHKDTWNSSDYELVVLTISSGVLLCERGSSSSYIGMLVKENVVQNGSRTGFYNS
jgi:hypothetical protein